MTTVIERLLALDARTAKFAALAAAAIVIGIGLPLASALNIWIDEAFTLHSTGAGIAYAWNQAIGFETQPPLYFVLEAGWRLLDESSIGFARFPSVIFAAAATALVVWTAHRFAAKVPPAAVALATAVNPIIIWAAVELRLYALVLLLGAGLTALFAEGFLVPTPSRRAQIGYAFCAIASLYTQYYIGFIFVAHGLVLACVRRGSLRAFAVTMIAVAAGFAPFVPVAVMHVKSSGGYVTALSVGKVIEVVAGAVFAAVLPHEPWWTGALKFAGFAAAAMLLGALIWIGRPGLDRVERGIGLAWLGSLAVFCLVFCLTGTPIDVPRHIIVVIPASLLAGLILVSSLTCRAGALRAVSGGVFAVFAVATLWVHYRPPLMKVGDWQRVSALLASQDRSTPIAVFPADLTLLLGTYLPAARPVAIPRPLTFTLDYDRTMTLRNEAEVARVLDPVRAGARELWVVTTGGCTADHLDYDYHCKFLEAYLNRRYRLEKSVAFRGALAQLYVRSSASSKGRSHAN